MNTEKFDFLKRLLEERILVLDGAMGSLVQCCVHEQGIHCENTLSDFLVKDNPAIIEDIHRRYLEAGADIIETDSFNSNSFSLSDYGREEEAYGLSFEAARLARKAADLYTDKTPEKPRFVAGSVGPTKNMLSLADGSGDVSFDSMAGAYDTQIRGLLDGGADIILLETVFDTLTVKAALYAIGRIEEERGEKIPVMVSCTPANTSGRLLSGQTLEAFVTSVRHAGLLSIGLNCGFGSGQMLPLLRRLSEETDTAVSVYPNAGLPDDCGEYTEEPEEFAANLEECLREGLINIVGGCCGTTPEHIKKLAETVRKYLPRKKPGRFSGLTVSNLEKCDIGRSEQLVHIGERTNVAGSRKFARLIGEGNFDEALEIAARQVQAGASVIDVCMDGCFEDASPNMTRFLRMINADGETGRAPVMIDSSDWSLITSAMKVCQGKPIVNSISLKDGEEAFMAKASEIRRLGGAAVVMLFDEEGQAVTFDRKIEVAERAYRLLAENGFNPADIIFDPNVLTVGVALTDRDPVALDFIRATEWIKKNLPGASVSGGISNLSFAFRSSRAIREAMHAVFLYHAAGAGLDMAIVNAEMVANYEDIEPELLNLVEDVILCRRDNAVGRLVEYAERQLQASEAFNGEGVTQENQPVEKRIETALIKGRTSDIESDVVEALDAHSPLEIIGDIMMPAMKRIGELFGEGKMFLPQVIKSAQVMHKAVNVLKPYFEETEGVRESGRVVIATVKGDVHDIGKNIVSLVISCNGYKVADLGVRVEAADIVEKAVAEKADAVLLSGLISPSLFEMEEVCREMKGRGLEIPVIIGGAATSEMHTAVRIAPVYSGPVFYSSDASENLRILSLLSDDTTREKTVRENFDRQKQLRELYASSKVKRNRNESDLTPVCKKKVEEVLVPEKLGREVYRNVPLEEVEKFIDWKWVLYSLDMERGKYVEGDDLSKDKVLEEVRHLFEKVKSEKLLNLEGVVEIFRASAPGDDIVVENGNGETWTLPMLRGLLKEGGSVSVADFLAPREDYIALFAVTSGRKVMELSERFVSNGDYYEAFLLKLIADRLAEAFAQWVHSRVRSLWWKDARDREGKPVEGVRIAFGYPAAPDHTLKKEVFELLDVESHTCMRLTESSMITPSEAVCGLIVPYGSYIDLGKIPDSILEAYARKRGVANIKTLLPNNTD